VTTEETRQAIREPESIDGVSVTYLVDEVLCDIHTPHQHLIIADTVAYGRALFLDGLIQSSITDEVLYHEPLIHPALLAHADPKRVLVGGAGEGASLREILRHTKVERLVAVDLDPEVVAACREHLGAWHQGAFEDPRVELRFEDVQDTLAASPDRSWDVVVLDITEPVAEGPAVDLFATRFFAEVARVLTDDGIMVLQSGEVDPAGMEVVRTVKSTLEAVFPWVRMLHTYVPSFNAMWGIALAGKRSFDLLPEDQDRRIATLEGLRMYDVETHRGLIHWPRFLAEQLAVPGEVVTGEAGSKLITHKLESER